MQDKRSLNYKSTMPVKAWVSITKEKKNMNEFWKEVAKKHEESKI